MSLAPVVSTPALRPAEAADAARPTADSAPRPRLRAVPQGTEARGFALYVGIDEAKAAAAGIDLRTLVDSLRRQIAELAPSAETYAAVALAPEGAGGRDVDVVRLALQDPSALGGRTEEPDPDVVDAVVIDLTRKRVYLGEEAAPLTYKEFELLQYLVLREGRTIARAELISALWAAADEDAPNERTIDVHVRRLRAKLGAYQDIVRTVRGTGYRFDRHADVVLRSSVRGPSPDVF
ncbi:MAG TPA: winged helix-turn-helix domain-containing protein [Naasia sp.]|jgi:DNA-binding winged helix-turn-helix (wHTH) protein